jgi:Transcriptional regulator
MNIHHLELFYYVARFGGIMEAVRHMPYGIQQPAVSGQVAQLEEFLGVTLFQRRPFSLTPEGKKLYNFIEPFFANLGRITSELQGGQDRQLRIGASAIILRDYLPKVIRALKGKYPKLNVSLHDGYPGQFEELLLRNEMDLAITVLSRRRRGDGLRSLALLELPMVLVVPKDSRIQKAAELWKHDRISEPLICLPQHELLCQLFQENLRRKKIDWFPSVEASSLELIDTYVANGLGIGLSVKIPQRGAGTNVREIGLEGFPSLPIGVLWRGKPGTVAQAFLKELQSAAGAISSPAPKAAQ